MRATLSTRRRFVALTGAAVLSGCNSADDETTGRTATDTPIPVMTPELRGHCSLNHWLFDEERDHQKQQRFEFSELSRTAKRYFERTLQQEGRYEVEDTGTTPPEITYTDVVTKYEISYDDETYVLGTASGAGCRVDD